MDTLMGWIGLGLLTLLGVSVVVACWEHTVGNRRREAAAAGAGDAASPRAVRVDVDLDRLPPAGGQRQQQAVYGAMLDSMVRGPLDPVSPGMHSWIETRPMVGLGAAAADDTSGKTASAA